MIMGKLKLRGYAKRNFTADLMEVTLTVSTDGETAAYAINKGKKESEKVLELLAELGVDLSKVMMKNESVSEPSRYHDNDCYGFEKNISFMTNASLQLLERLSLGIAEREINATYRERFCLSNADNISKQVLQDALIDSRKKAEAVAETLGQRVVGIDSAKCDEYRNDDNDEDVSYCMKYTEREYAAGVLLADQLSPDKIEVEIL